MKSINGGVCAPQGFAASGIHCGLRKNKSKNDLSLIYSQVRCAAAAVYTQNIVKGAPLIVTKQHLEDGYAQAVICNSGNANTCNADGIEIAGRMCASVADNLGICEKDVIVASTGVIGQPLNVDAIIEGIPRLKAELSAEGSSAAMLGIMTTDTMPKQASYEFEIGGKTVSIGAIAKGSGMINVNMATMLCFITTDVAISPVLLQQALSDVVQDSFNMVCVDGDTSTNDMVTVLASGLAGNPLIDTQDEEYSVFRRALFEVSKRMCKLIARDGEGATKRIECRVKNAADKQAARKIAKTVISSSLVKSMIFGADANCGRVLCALGYSGVQVDLTKVNVSFSSDAGDIEVCAGGYGLPFDEAAASEILRQEKIKITIDLQDGFNSVSAWGCDLTYDYVRINADYRS